MAVRRNILKVIVMSLCCLMQTTLFQDKLVDATNPSSIYVNNTAHSLSTDLTKQPTFFGTENMAAVLRDVNGN